METNLIGIAGKMQAGKDTLGGMINKLSTQEWQIKKFAGKLKQVVSLLIGIPIENLEKEEIKSSYLSEEWNKLIIDFDRAYVGLPTSFVHKYTVREFLQKVGTDALRDVIHPNIWVNALFADYGIKDLNYFKAFPQNYDLPNWIITDVRFPNEAEAVKERGGKLIKVIRNNNTGDHPSETALDNYDSWDFIVPNTGTLDDLLYQAEYIVDTLKLR